MAGEWRTSTLGDVIELKRGYDLSFRERREGPFPIVSSSGISGYHSEAKVKAPGVVTGRYGTLGEIYFVTTLLSGKNGSSSPLDTAMGLDPLG